MKRRELSDFMVEEMLYDYATRELDSDREHDMKEVIDKSKNFQEELAKIQLGLNYFEGLSRLQTSLSLIEEIRGQKSYWHQIRSAMSFSRWPPIVKWTLEAISIIGIVVLLTALVPWVRLRDYVLQESQTELIIAEVSKSRTRTQLSAANNESSSFEDEESTPAMTKPVATVTPPKTPTAAVVEPTTTTPQQVQVPVKTKAVAKEPDVKKQGFVYRGTVKIINSEAGSIKIRQKVVELGARKAGEVELGWKRNQGDYYFHFTIPENKFNEAQDFIKSLGDLQISRDPHPRLMPDGILRIILTAEESQN